jgi:predicted Ser/Thr protein kinase
MGQSENGGTSVADEIGAVAESVEKRFQRGRRVLSFSEYLDLFASDPVRFARDASRYLRDCFDHFGTIAVDHPWGKFTRWKLFDLGWDPSQAHHALIGQEQVQEEIYRSVSNFVREGRPNRLVLLHGPNGSAKSTIVACVMRGLEHYSTLDTGALYRFNWVFPSSKTLRGSLGFGNKEQTSSQVGTYAHLPDDQIDAKLLLEVRDHPLFLIPIEERQRLLERLAQALGGAVHHTREHLIHFLEEVLLLDDDQAGVGVGLHEDPAAEGRHRQRERGRLRV